MKIFKLIALILSISMFVSMLPIVTLASSSEYEYEAIEGSDSIKITDYIGAETNVIVPSEIDGHKVTEIAEYAFADNTDIVSVKIPDTVTKLGSGVFKNCTSLEEVTLPSNITDMFRRVKTK